MEQKDGGKDGGVAWRNATTKLMCEAERRVAQVQKNVKIIYKHDASAEVLQMMR